MIVPRRKLLTPTRRALLLGAPAIVAFANIERARAAIVDSYGNPVVATGPLTTYSGLSVNQGPTGFPGQAGNPVGYAVINPTLTTWPGGSFTSGTSGSPTVYQSYDFNSGSGGVSLPSGNNYITFKGCRFQSNNQVNYNVQVSGATNIIFEYCSFVPLASQYTSPPGSTWPSAGAGAQTTTFSDNVNCTIGASGYQYGLNILSGGPITAQYCDFWGFGNAGPIFYSTTAQMIIDNCWIHDARNSNTHGDHTDGTGYLNGGTAPQNVTVSNCTIASIGNTDGLAFQQGSGYNNVIISGCYLSGYGYTCVLFAPSSSSSNCQFKNNTLGTDLPPVFGGLYEDFTTIFSAAGMVWSGNQFSVRAGTSNTGTARPSSWTSGQNGYFLWPNGTLNAADWVHP